MRVPVMRPDSPNYDQNQFLDAVASSAGFAVQATNTFLRDASSRRCLP